MYSAPLKQKILKTGYIFNKDILINNSNSEWQILDHIATGSLACIYTIRNLDSKIMFVAKVIHKIGLKGDENHFSDMEITVSRKIVHKDVVRCLHYMEDKRCHVLIFDHYKNGSLKDMIIKRTTLTEPEIRYFTIQIVHILLYLQS
jgi:cell cycle serine/threonine-protein kinase CDC5/MSD2